MSNSISLQLSRCAEELAPISDTPLLDCQILLCNTFGKDRSWLYAHSTDEVSEPRLAQFETSIQRRRAGEPIAYILGHREFWNRTFAVTPDILIPRPETELLVEIALDILPASACLVADIGTGSGAIAISLASERSNWQLIGTDLSTSALQIAANNATDLSNIEWVQGDLCHCLAPNAFDLIVSNPPYIAEDDPHLDQLQFEPRSALTAGKEGLDCLQTIIQDAKYNLKAGRFLLLEHGFDQQDAVMQLFANQGYVDIKAFSDLAGSPRAIIARMVSA